MFLLRRRGWSPPAAIALAFAFLMGLAPRADAADAVKGRAIKAAECVDCHTKETPGVVVGWKASKMAAADISCMDCHQVRKDSPMASQCKGIAESATYISPMISPNTCAGCHADEVEQFSQSGHAKFSAAALVENEVYKKLMYDLEGGIFLGNDPKSPTVAAARATGCQPCHGTVVELGPDNRPINATWPGGVGTRYPDGGVGNCTVCHTRHAFSRAEARKPAACSSCHLGPDHPDIEIYMSSKHGHVYQANGEKWKWDSESGKWEPGDYLAPTCAVCHMSGIGDLSTTHNINERLKWNLVHARSVVRTGERGDGEKGRPLMRQVCSNCHSSLHTDAAMANLDNAVELYNFHYDKTVVMRETLDKANLLNKEDPWKDAFQEMFYYLGDHVSRRARHGAAMFGADDAHWKGFFQIFQIVKDMQNIHDTRLKNKKIEELSPVMPISP